MAVHETKKKTCNLQKSVQSYKISFIKVENRKKITRDRFVLVNLRDSEWKASFVLALSSPSAEDTQTYGVPSAPSGRTLCHCTAIFPSSAWCSSTPCPMSPSVRLADPSCPLPMSLRPSTRGFSLTRKVRETSGLFQHLCVAHLVGSVRFSALVSRYPWPISLCWPALQGDRAQPVLLCYWSGSVSSYVWGQVTEPKRMGWDCAPQARPDWLKVEAGKPQRVNPPPLQGLLCASVSAHPTGDGPHDKQPLGFLTKLRPPCSFTTLYLLSFLCSHLFSHSYSSVLLTGQWMFTFHNGFCKITGWRQWEASMHLHISSPRMWVFFRFFPPGHSSGYMKPLWDSSSPEHGSPAPWPVPMSAALRFLGRVVLSLLNHAELAGGVSLRMFKTER